MPTLRIIRDSGYADLVRTYAVLVDGTELGKLQNGETRDFTIAAGEHSARLKIDWAGSQPLQFSICDGETVVLLARSNLRGFRLLLGIWYATFGAGSYLLLEKA